jgi:netrin-G3 ligand
VFIGALQISSSEEEDQGKYECVAENVVGTEYSQSTMLYVKGESLTCYMEQSSFRR